MPVQSSGIRSGVWDTCSGLKDACSVQTLVCLIRLLYDAGSPRKTFPTRRIQGNEIHVPSMQASGMTHEVSGIPAVQASWIPVHTSWMPVPFQATDWGTWSDHAMDFQTYVIPVQASGMPVQATEMPVQASGLHVLASGLPV